jgi:hypothetical protein
MIPGRLLHRLATTLCSAEMRERVIEAVLADSQHEWLEAGTPRSRLMALAKCWSSFWVALAGCLAHDLRHDIAGFTKRVLVPIGWTGFWVTVGLITLGGRSWVRDGRVDEAEFSRDLRLVSAYLPAVVIMLYRNKFCQRRSWAGLAWSLGLMLVFLATRELFSEFRFILGWAAGSCVAASWTFLVRKPDHRPLTPAHRP